MADKDTAIYYRVSTTDQNPENQRVAVSEWCINKKIAPTDIEVYRDVISGITDLRPNLKRLVLDIQAGKIKRVIVWRLDRLGRSLQHLISLMDLFKKYNVEFISIKENIDTSNSAGVLMFHIIGAMAQFERDLISERAKLSVLYRRAHNLPVGRQKDCKDKRKRKTDGYRRRYLLKHYEEAKALFNLHGAKAHMRQMQKLGKQLGLNGDEVDNPNLPTQGRERNG